jgi:uncharacterized membrane protein YeaQ/YmgE (transglycosylase-associated protein family)
MIGMFITIVGSLCSFWILGAMGVNPTTSLAILLGVVWGVTGAVIGACIKE